MHVYGACYRQWPLVVRQHMAKVQRPRRHMSCKHAPSAEARIQLSGRDDALRLCGGERRGGSSHAAAGEVSRATVGVGHVKALGGEAARRGRGDHEVKNKDNKQGSPTALWCWCGDGYCKQLMPTPLAAAVAMHCAG
jgi:hypothetical protein